MNFWNILNWFFSKPEVYVPTLVTTLFIGGYTSAYVSDKGKSGLVIHDWGYELHEQPDGTFLMWVEDANPPQYSSHVYDLRNDPVACGKKIAEVGVNRFKKYGCSYPFMPIGDHNLQFQTMMAITAHAKGWNSFSIGVGFPRTDSEEFNRKSYNTFKNVSLPMIKDSLAYYDNGSAVEFIVMHQDVATNGKTDPRPYKYWFEEDGLRFDNRLSHVAIDLLPLEK